VAGLLPDCLRSKGLGQSLPCGLPHGVAGVPNTEHGVVKGLGRQLEDTQASTEAGLLTREGSPL